MMQYHPSKNYDFVASLSREQFNLLIKRKRKIQIALWIFGNIFVFVAGLVMRFDYLSSVFVYLSSALCIFGAFYTDLHKIKLLRDRILYEDKL